MSLCLTNHLKENPVLQSCARWRQLLLRSELLSRKPNCRGLANLTREHAPSTGRTAAPHDTAIVRLSGYGTIGSMDEGWTFSSPAKFNRGNHPDLRVSGGWRAYFNRDTRSAHRPGDAGDPRILGSVICTEAKELAR